MYVTRPLSLYKKSPESLSIPPEGPNSGFLVLQDEELETTSCFGSRKCDAIKDLPFPQNKDLRMSYVQSYGQGMVYYSIEHAVFIPVLNQPLSSNMYYVIHQDGKHQGNAYTCSKEEDKRRNCFFIKRVKDTRPKPLNPNNTYQQIKICPYKAIFLNGFTATSASHDGFPPQFLRNKGWEIKAKYPKSFRVGEALGLSAPLRARLPNFDFPISVKVSTPVTVGKWICPFIFIKEGKTTDQMERSMFYEMMLEQRWEQIYLCSSDNNTYKNNTVLVEVETHGENVFVDGVEEVMWDPRGDVDGVVWFREGVLGLNVAVIERMRWEQERGGWRGNNNKGNVLKVNRVEEYLGFGDWNKFGCYVLVERFVLKRMDGSLVLTYDFKHTHQIRSKWE